MARWGVDVRVDSPVCFTDTNYAFANEEMWAFTQGNYPGHATWVETGLKFQRNMSSEYYTYNFFWGDVRSVGGTYTYHAVTGVNRSMGGLNGVHVAANGNDWNVYNLGQLVGTSANNPGPNTYADNGLEVRYAATYIDGKTANAYRKLPNGGSLINGWNDPYLVTTGPTTVSWGSSSHYGVFTGYHGVSCNARAVPMQKLMSRKAGEGDLRRIALAFAAENGDDSPTYEQYGSTRYRALASMGNEDVTFDKDRPVTVAIMSGKFVANTASPPQGTELPSGGYLTMVLDQSGVILDWSIGNSKPDTKVL